MLYEQEHFKVVFERPYVIIYHDSLNNVIIAEWKEFVMGENAREALNVGLDHIIKNESHRWLSDTRKLGVVSAPDQKWVINDWFPRALAGGIREMATVQSESDVAQMGVKKMMKKSASDELQQAYFETPEDAHAWLILESVE